MERVTFHRPDVTALLSTMVCMKIDAGGDETPDLARRFGVSGFPTLVLLGPAGETIYCGSGAPPPEGFAVYFAVDRYNAAIRSLNAKRYADVAPNLFFVTKWFGDTELGKDMRKIHDQLEQDEKFAAAYAEAKKAHERKLARARKKLEEIARTRAQAKAELDKAAALYGKYMKSSAYKAYRKVILEYPDLPEADEARAFLRAHKQKWKEPKK